MHPLELFKYCPKCGSSHFEVRNAKAKKCADCGFVYYFNSSAATVAFILNRKNELLVCRRGKEPAKGTLDLSGGFIDLYETGEEGVAREVMEETGLKVTEAVYQFSLPNTYLYSGFLVHTLDLFFLCRVEDDSRLQAMDDVADSFWMPLGQIRPEEFGLDSVREGVARFWLYINQSDMKRKRKLGMAGLLCVMPWWVFAQQVEPLADPVRLFEDGKALFLRHDYAAAWQALTHYLRQDTSAGFAEEVAYMLACTSYELNQPDRIRRLLAYVEQYPDSRYVNRIYALIGSACFFDKDYPEAIMYFDKCDIHRLADAERDDVLLRLGTSYLKEGNLKDASLWFTVLEDVSSEYRLDAVYQLAYIDYARGRYDEALEGFRLAGTDEKYAPYTPYYIADICLEKHDYQKAKRLADTYLEAYPRHEYALSMQRVRGEASYGMGRYAEAVKPLETYCESPEGSHDRKALYTLGMSYYQTGVYSKAVDALGKAVGRPDALAQNAYLHSGLAYLQLKDRTRARMAFEQASVMTFDRNVQEQALYNYALCIHETSYSPFAESVTVFERFLNGFPNSAYAAKVNDYLVEVYMNTRSYQAALNSIAKISHPGDRILEAKQKLLFRIGILAFAQAAFENAIDYFTQSIGLGRYDLQTKADAYYWRGESKYRMEHYAEAASDYRLYLEYTPDRTGEEYALALYNLGYVAFKQKHYEQALTWFTRCSQAQVKDRRIVADVYNRMGDCHFHARRFEEASALYAQASAADPSLGDYSLFQEAFVKGLQRDYAGKYRP